MLRVQLYKRRGDFTLDVDFCAPVPGITALFGRSGCGKSTLISLVAGLLLAEVIARRMHLLLGRG